MSQETSGKKRRKRKKFLRRGRIKTAEKLARAKRTEKVPPDGVAESDCWLSHKRVVWRLENGQAVLVAHEVHRVLRDQHGQVPGVLERSECRLEIFVDIVY